VKWWEANQPPRNTSAQCRVPRGWAAIGQGVKRFCTALVLNPNRLRAGANGFHPACSIVLRQTDLLCLLVSSRRFPTGQRLRNSRRVPRSGPCLWGTEDLIPPCSILQRPRPRRGQSEFTRLLATSYTEAVGNGALSLLVTALPFAERDTSRRGGLFSGPGDIGRMSRRCCQGPWRQ